jgi:hypothetical protein
VRQEAVLYEAAAVEVPVEESSQVTPHRRVVLVEMQEI